MPRAGGHGEHEDRGPLPDGQEARLPLRQKGAGHVRRGLAVAACLPGLCNAAASTRLAHRAAAFVGIDPRRSLPRVTERTFSKRFPRSAAGRGPAEVALFNDTWNEYQRPEVGESAVHLFAATGARVRLPEVVCCGRPMLSEGLVEDARENAKRNLDLLFPLVEGGVPLAGLEPSCILTIRDDYKKLLPDDERVEKGRRGHRLFEEALLELVEEAQSFRSRKDRRSCYTATATRRLWWAQARRSGRSHSLGRRLRRWTPAAADGGLFGYEKGHYEVSMKMGERRLFLAVRGSKGVSWWRPEPLAGSRSWTAPAGRRALHPAEYLAALLHDV